MARVGGDEFAVIQPLAGHPSDAAVLAERIVTELAEPYDVDGQMITVGGSVGVALFPADGTTTLALMTSGALALNRAKRDGRNTWRYCEPGMDYLLRERRALEGDLRVALVEGQLALAVPAVLPWRHPGNRRLRGVAAMEPPQPRSHRARRFHSGRGEMRPDRPDRPVGVANRLRRSGFLGPAARRGGQSSPIQFGATIAPTVDAVCAKPVCGPLCWNWRSPRAC